MATELIKKHIDDYQRLAKNSKTHIRVTFDFTADGKTHESLELGKGALDILHQNFNQLKALVEEIKTINKE